MDKMSSKHYMLFIFGVTFISLITYSSLFITLGGIDTWLCVIVAFILLILFAMYLLKTAYSRKIYDLHDIFTIGLSKPIGNIFLFLFALGLFLASVESAAVEANCIKCNFFMETPEWYIIIFFILPSMFLIGKNFKTIVIFIITTTFGLIVNSIILSLLSENYKDITYILPVLKDGFSINLVNCTLLILGSISAFVICLPYLKALIKFDKLKHHSLIALCIIALYCIYSIIGVISTFGPLRSANLFYPAFTQSQRVDIGGFIEFGELFFLIQSVLGLFIKYLLCSYGIYLLYKKFIHNNKLFITIYSLAIFVAASFLGKNNYFLFTVLNYYNYANLFFFIAIPLIAFIAFSIKVPKKQ